MALTDTKIRKIKSKDKSFKIADGKGLFLVVMPNGSKYWRFRYRFADKEKLLAIGIYPDVGLADARRKRDEARKLLADDIDPSMAKQLKKRAKKLVEENSFESIAREWHIKFSSQWTPDHAGRILLRLEKDILPWLGQRLINEITAPELLTIIRRIENRGAVETAHRAMQNCGQIFRYAIATGRAERDISADLRGSIPPVRKRHLASIIEPKAIGNLLRALNDYNGHFITKSALQLAPLVFVRAGELRKAEWSEINFEIAEWRIPPEKMKMRITHIVPPSNQALAILREI